MLKWRTVFSQRQVSCPDTDKSIYVEGMKSEKLLPADINKRRGLVISDRYNMMGCTTNKREASKAEIARKIAGPIPNWHRERLDYWDTITPKKTSTHANFPSEIEKLHVLAHDVKNLPKPVRTLEHWTTPSTEEWERVHVPTLQVNGRTVIGLTKPRRRVVPYGNTGRLAMNFATTNLLARHRIRLELVQPDGSTNGPNPLYVNPRTNAPFAPGDLVERDLVGLCITKQKIQTVDTIHRDKKCLAVVYKNEAPSIDQLVLDTEKIRDYVLSDQYDKNSATYKDLEKKYNEEFHYNFNGSGGSGQKKGAVALSANVASPEDCHHVLGGGGQDPNTPENLAMTDCAHNQNVVAFFVWLPKWLEPKRDKSIDMNPIRARCGMKLVGKASKNQKETKKNSEGKSQEEEEETEEEGEDSDSLEEDEDERRGRRGGWGGGDQRRHG